MTQRRISALDDGRIHVDLPSPEHDLLRSLPEQLAPILRGERDVAGAHERLFPPAYDDADADAAYRDLVSQALADERLAALEAFAETLDAGVTHAAHWQTDLDRDQAEAWLSATNDARLVLATVVGIRSEAQWEEPSTARSPAGAALLYLGLLQEELLDALSGG